MRAALRVPSCAAHAHARAAGWAVRRLHADGTSLLREQAWIGGRWVSAHDVGRSFCVEDPGQSGRVLGELPDMGAAEASSAVDSAVRGLAEWRKTTGKQRCEMLREIFLQHRRQAEALSELLSSESGKPLAEARGEVAYGAGYYEWFAEEAKRQYGDVVPEPVPGRRILSVREPVGVCALITPWNFPSAMLARKLAPALAAGCSVVVKPAAETPLSTLAVARLLEQAGLPAGVVNVVTASQARAAEVGRVWCADARVRKVSFTGSTRVGRLLMRDSADSVKRLSMELGGDAPFLVFDDADLDQAVEGLIASKFRNAGQTCVSANRVLVQAGVYDAFAAKLARRVAAMPVGWYRSGGACGGKPPLIGPLISDAALAKVQALVRDAVGKGAELLCGGEPLQGLGSARFFAPTVLANCSRDMRVMQEEIFGPVAPLAKFASEEEALALANATEAGLAAYFFTSNLQRVFRLSQALEAGMVGINTGAISSEVVPFGGVKQSGLGREGGKYGLDDYTSVKTITIQVV